LGALPCSPRERASARASAILLACRRKALRIRYASPWRAHRPSDEDVAVLLPCMAAS
jgi:hypothetical protein